MRVAIFDFDGTVYKKETFRVLMNYLKNHPTYQTKYKSFLVKMLPYYLGYKIKLVPEQKMKTKSVKLYLKTFDNQTPKQINEFFQGVNDLLAPDYNQKVIQSLEKHQADQLHTMLVSGAYTEMLQVINKQFGFAEIIGTNIPYENGVHKNRMPILHVNGIHKKEAILSSLKNQEIDWENSYAYADSFSDLYVLEMVGNPVAVNPDQKLRKIATERNWTILEN